MLTDESFLELVLAAPDDAAPRLAYAKWLEEQGAAIVAHRTAVHALPPAASQFAFAGHSLGA